MKIIPIASGKGGVGKSSIAANLSVLLGQKGKKIVLIDLDLGGSNLHLLLGIRRYEKGIGSYLTANNLKITDIIIKTEYENLSFIPGDAGIPGLANVDFAKKKGLMMELFTIDADYVILDLGAGTAFNIIDFFLISSQGIVVTAPNSAATLMAYLFLKNAIFRIMASAFPKRSAGYQFIENLKKNSVNLQNIDINHLKKELLQIDAQNYTKFETLLKTFQPRLIMNFLSEPAETKLVEKVKYGVKQYLGINLDYLGVVLRDDVQNQSLASGLPIVLYKPQAVMSRALNRVVQRLLDMEATEANKQFLPAGDEAESFIFTEVEDDYKKKAASIADLFVDNAIKEGDLLETLKMQQYELNQLRKENRFLKHKITQIMKP